MASDYAVREHDGEERLKREAGFSALFAVSS